MNCSRTALGGGALRARPVGCCAYCILVWETPVIQPIRHDTVPPGSRQEPSSDHLQVPWELGCTRRSGSPSMRLAQERPG